MCVWGGGAWISNNVCVGGGAWISMIVYTLKVIEKLINVVVSGLKCFN